jgi:hypothetical protein
MRYPTRYGLSLTCFRFRSAPEIPAFTSGYAELRFFQRGFALPLGYLFEPVGKSLGPISSLLRRKEKTGFAKRNEYQ